MTHHTRISIKTAYPKEEAEVIKTFLYKKGQTYFSKKTQEIYNSDDSSEFLGIDQNKNLMNNIPENNFNNNFITQNNKFPVDFINQLSNNNIIFKHLLYLITEQEYKFKYIENKMVLDSYIKHLDSTPVYLTYNCGILYIPNKSKYILFINFLK